LVWVLRLIRRVGELELQAPRDRDGRFSSELFERCQRPERALVAALAEMYARGVSGGKSKPLPKIAQPQLFGIIDRRHQ
jgi:transposase-like protein